MSDETIRANDIDATETEDVVDLEAPADMLSDVRGGMQVAGGGPHTCVGVTNVLNATN